MRLNELPPEDWPREKMLRAGPEALTDGELIALLVRSGNSERDVFQLSHHILKEAGGLRNLSRQSPHEIIQTINGIGPAKACELCAVFELGRRAAREQFLSEKLDSPEAVHALMAHEMQALRQESLRVILLNTRYKLMRVVVVSTGSVNESIADPREIFRPAVVHNAFAIILVHNHPSGDPSPSDTDRRMTDRMREVAGHLRIRLLDHVIIGCDSPDHQPFFSFKEAGLL
jgi:DNA repair protein RadC